MARRFIHILHWILMAEMALGVIIVRLPRRRVVKSAKPLEDEMKSKYDIMEVLRKSNAEVKAIQELLLKVTRSQTKKSWEGSEGILEADNFGPYNRDSYQEMQLLDDIAKLRYDDSKKERYGIV